jgi:hypothetical protein
MRPPRRTSTTTGTGTGITATDAIATPLRFDANGVLCVGARTRNPGNASSLLDEDLLQQLAEQMSDEVHAITLVYGATGAKSHHALGDLCGAVVVEQDAK